MRRFFDRQVAGFSLIELIIIVLIIGILASIGIPLYFEFRKKAIGVEARTNLIALYRFELNYFSENDTFTSDLDVLGFSPETIKYYAYEVAESSKTGFTGKASGNIDNDPILDVWTIDDHQSLVHVTQD